MTDKQDTLHDLAICLRDATRTIATTTKTLQRFLHIPADGIVGPETLNAARRRDEVDAVLRANGGPADVR